jgi:ribosomal protein S12 methylthiotransferase accessory factor
VALWWRGGLPPRPIALEDPALGQAAALLARLRRDRAAFRRSWLLDITTDLGIASVAAVSVGADGHGVCCGFAARAAGPGGGLAAAAEAAVLELAQMELGQALAARHAALRGAEALNPVDAAHLRRRSGIDAARCALLHPAGPPAVIAPLAAEGAAAEAVLAALLDRLARHGLAPIRLDHAATGAVCLPVLRVLCPGLESETSPLAGPRLRDAVARTGGGPTHRAGITLT